VIPSKLSRRVGISAAIAAAPIAAARRFAYASRPKGHYVVPWGGREGRLGTNPIAYGVPTSHESVVSHFATSVVPEGVVRLNLQEGRQTVSGAIVDAGGRPTTEPAAFYGPPRGGLLPFGGPVGYKGYALSMLAEFLAGSLAGLRADDATRSVNGLWLHVMDPRAFGDAELFKRRASEFVGYVRSSPPADGVDRVMVPGERERSRHDERGGRLLLQAATWKSIRTTAASLGLDR
jgi:hydroxycarboxylate dehydrogenase B